MPCCSQWLQSCPTLCDPMDYNPPGSPVHGISPAEYWSGMPLTPSWDLPDPGVKPTSLASPALAGMFFTTEPLGKPSRNHDSLSLSRGLSHWSDGKESSCNAGDPGSRSHNPSQISTTSALLKCICLSFILFSLTFPPPILCLSFLVHFLILIISNSGSHLYNDT